MKSRIYKLARKAVKKEFRNKKYPRRFASAVEKRAYGKSTFKGYTKARKAKYTFKPRRTPVKRFKGYRQKINKNWELKPRVSNQRKLTTYSWFQV